MIFQLTYNPNSGLVQVKSYRHRVYEYILLSKSDLGGQDHCGDETAIQSLWVFASPYAIESWNGKDSYANNLFTTKYRDTSSGRIDYTGYQITKSNASQLIYKMWRLKR